jgi:hypothetical protein
MKTLFGLSVFSVGGVQYYWEDVVLAAMAWGDWTLLREEVRKGLACAKLMRDKAESPSDEEMDSSMRAFRYAHELLSVEDLETWLSQWGLNTSEWMKYICMSLLKTKWAGDLSEIMARFPVTDEEIDLHIKAEGVCSGQLVSFCRKLAARTSMLERQKHEIIMDAFLQNAEDESKGFLKTFKENLKKSSQMPFSSENSQKKLETLAELEVCFCHFCRHAFTPEAIMEQIRCHSFDWIRIDCRRISFSDLEIAREALLCVKEDGEALTDVADRIKKRVYEDHFYMDQLDSSLHSHFLYARKGELIGHVDLSGEPTLFLICDKRMPSDADSYIKQRAQDKILENTIDHEIQNRIRWEASIYKE